jgi:hypothetical protein
VAAESLVALELVFQLQPLGRLGLEQLGQVLALEQVLELVQERELLQQERLVMMRYLRLEQVRFQRQQRYLLELKFSLIYRQQVMEFQYRLYRLRLRVTVHQEQLDRLRLLANGLLFPQLRSHRELASLLKMTFSLNAPLFVSDTYSNEQPI